MTEKPFHYVIIGGGPGGYVAALRAAQLGHKTALVEAETLGGVCLNWGCIPTKALLRTAEIKHVLEQASDFGLKISGKISQDWTQVIQRSREVSQRLSKGIDHLMRKNKIQVFKGWGRLLGAHQGQHRVDVQVSGKTTEILKAPTVILATGARARCLPGIEADGKTIWTARDAMMASECPDSLLIIGSGAIGMEFASFYQTMGAKVTVVELQERVLPIEDREISEHVLKSFQNQGVNFFLSSKVKHVTLEKKGRTESATVVLETPEGEKKGAFEKILLAVGIQGNTENLGLEKTRVSVVKGHIQTDGWGQTQEPGIYAIGDVTAPPWLAHKASHEGILAVEHSSGLPALHPLRPEAIPGCTYCSPQVASVGLTEEKAKSQGHTIKVGRFPYLANGKALAMGETEGLIKVIFEATTGELLGAHMVGAEVTELIQGFVLALTNELTEAEIMHTVFPHPTLSEMMPESVLNAYNRGLHR